MINCKIEDKLIELKEQFCKWNCKHKDKEIYLFCEESSMFCKDCIDYNYCDTTGNLVLCQNCKINDFIKYIRDDLE